MKYISLLLFLLVLFYGCESSITNADIDGPKSTIRYSIPSKSQVKLILENSYDTLIATLVDAIQEPGYYEIEFDTDNLAEGIYFYTLTARSIENNSYFEATRKLLLIKR